MTHLQLHSLADVAKLLGVSQKFLEREARAGKLPHVALGNSDKWKHRRMTDEHLALYLAQNTQGKEKPKGRRGSRGQPVV